MIRDKNYLGPCEWEKNGGNSWIFVKGEDEKEKEIWACKREESRPRLGSAT